MARFPAISCALAALFLAVVSAVSATVFTVGDSAGWDISADLTSWASTKTFFVGDTLLFQYSRYHSLSEVDRAGYDACSTTNALLTGTGGNTTVPLAAPGDRFFVCGAKELNCLGGMKPRVRVQVNSSSAVTPAGALQPRAEAPSPALLQWDGRDFPFSSGGGGGGGGGEAATARAACSSAALSMCALSFLLAIA